MRNSVAASARTSGRPASPGAVRRMIGSAPIRKSAAGRAAHRASLRVAASASRHPEPPRRRSRVQAAVSDSDSVPSPNSRRAMYGIRRAAVSASAVPEPPSSHAMLASRTKPRSREASVPAPTISALRNEFGVLGEGTSS